MLSILYFFVFSVSSELPPIEQLSFVFNPHQLYSRIAASGAWTDMHTECNEIGGVSFGDGDYCATENLRQLSAAIADGMQTTNIKEDCHFKWDGVSYGWLNEFCAVEGNLKQIQNVVPGTGVSGSMVEACVKMGGTLFGSNTFCAVSDDWNQLSNEVIGGDGPADMHMTCSSLGGIPFGTETNVWQHCAVKGYTQLTMQMPGTSVSSIEGLSDFSTLCEGEFDGEPFGESEQHCAVSDEYVQLSTHAPGGSAYDMKAACTELEGISFGYSGEHCAVKQKTQMYGLESSEAANVCATLEGVLFGQNNEYCAVHEDWVQYTSKPPGAQNAVIMETECGTLGGVSFGQGYHCAVKYEKKVTPTPTTSHVGKISFSAVWVFIGLWLMIIGN